MNYFVRAPHYKLAPSLNSTTISDEISIRLEFNSNYLNVASKELSN